MAHLHSARPHATPDAAAVEAARRAVEHALPAAYEVTADVAENPRFIDAGTNFERVACPSCGADLDDWWPAAMSDAADDDFRDLSVVTPCCPRTTTLNDLSYDWPQGFARVSIHAMNPGISILDPQIRGAVDRHLGIPTRIIWQHI